MDTVSGALGDRKAHEIVKNKMKKHKEEIEKDYKNEIDTFKKISKIVYDLGSNFLGYNAWELAERQFKLSWYKFFLSDFVSDLNRISESLKLKIKEFKANEWQPSYDELVSKLWKVSNKEQVENLLLTRTMDLLETQWEYEAMYIRYKMKLSAVDDILTAIAQRIKSLQEESKYM
jgi:hypothetical protein